MAIPLPNLDDRSYADLVDEARTLIPTLDPDWTDHNPGDPGIALVELFAWLTEMLGFATNQIPPSHVRTFLALLDGPDATTSPPAAQVGTGPQIGMDAAITATMRRLREPYRAVTPADYEQLVTSVWPASDEAAGFGQGAGIRRAACVPRRNLEAADALGREADAPAHVSVVVLPQPQPGEEYPKPTAGLLEAISAFLAPRRLLGSRHHVVGPQYVDVQVSAQLALLADSPPQEALDAVLAALRRLLSPVAGGLTGDGRPFGRDVYVSQVYAELEQVALVDYADQVTVTGGEPIQGPDGVGYGAALGAHQLARLAGVELVAYDVLGRPHPLSWTAPA